jgi:hypothetical protein
MALENLLIIDESQLVYSLFFFYCASAKIKLVDLREDEVSRGVLSVLQTKLYKTLIFLFTIPNKAT